MKRSSIFLQAVILLIGLGALAFMLWEPHIEGRNAHSTLYQIYFNDPFLAYGYIASIPFYIVLYQAAKVLGLYRINMFVSPASLKALRTIKYYAISLVGFVAIGEIIIMMSNSDDRAGGVFMGVLIALGSLMIATSAIMIEKRIRKAVDIKSTNDLPV